MSPYRSDMPHWQTNNQAVSPPGSSSTGYSPRYPDVSSDVTARRAHFQGTRAVDQDSRPTYAQHRRIREFQRRWEKIKGDLPPQLSDRHIKKISIGGVIGTGLFLGSGAALYDGGPAGALIGYSIIGTVVYCLCVSIGEMIAWLPNVGGVVGLADLYVDPALGFSLGWAAWYNWSITLPAELNAAVVIASHWKEWNYNTVVLTISFFVLAVLVNCFPARVYGKFEYCCSLAKITMIILIFISSVGVFTGLIGDRAVKFSNWSPPFSTGYLGIDGTLGRFLGFWAVLMQASFSFFGSEVPGIAAGEVIDATRNVPRALRRVWIRITLFYIGGIFCAGIIVDRGDYSQLINTSNVTGTVGSPFVVGFNRAKPNAQWIPYVINATVLLSAWSAASSDVYISSRFLYFLARTKHAPSFFASLIRYPSSGGSAGDPAEDEVRNTAGFQGRAFTERRHGVEDSEQPPRTSTDDKKDYFRPQHGYQPGWGEVPLLARSASYSSGAETLYEESDLPALAYTESRPETSESSGDPESGPREKSPWYVLPLFAVLGSASVGLLAFLNSIGNAGGRNDSSGSDNHSGAAAAQAAFNWLVAAASVASLQSWSAMLFTYIRWYQGTAHAEKEHREKIREAEEKHDDLYSEWTIKNSSDILEQIKQIRKNRHPGQPYLALWAFGICVTILATNGWTVFVHNNWRIADISGEIYPPDDGSVLRVAHPVSIFMSSYIPIPVFFLLMFGYKIIFQTKMISVENMDFSRGEVPMSEAKQKPTYNNMWKRALHWMLD